METESQKIPCPRPVRCFARGSCRGPSGGLGPDTTEAIRLSLPNLALVAIALHCGGGPANGGALDVDFSESLVEETRTANRDDGQATLTWEFPRHTKLVELQQDSTDRFTDPVLRYSGTDTGSVITGLPEGSHFFRIRALDAKGEAGPWSEPFEVKVVYMERTKVVWLLIGGGLIVVSTVGAILIGHFRRSEEG